MGFSTKVRLSVLLACAVGVSMTVLAALPRAEGRQGAPSERVAAIDGWQVKQLTRPGVVNVPRLALAPNGAAVAVWATTSETIFAKRFVPGHGWTHRVIIGHGFFTQVSMNGRGDIAVAWEAQVGPLASVVRVAFRPADGPWRQPVTVFRGKVWDTPEVSVGPKGKVTVAVEASALEGPIARTMVFTRVHRWTGPRILSAPGAHTWSTRVVTGPHGGVTVAWTHSRDIRHHRVCTSVTVPRGWSSPRCWDTRSNQMELDADDRGRVYVLDGIHLWSGGPSRAWRREPAPSVQDNCLGLAIDAAGNGRVAAMWMIGCQEVGPIVVKVARRFPGGGWSSLRKLAGNGVGDVAISDKGVVYALVNRLAEGLAVTRKRPGSSWSAPTLLGQNVFGIQIQVANSSPRALWAEGFGPSTLQTARRAR